MCSVEVGENSRVAWSQRGRSKGSMRFCILSILYLYLKHIFSFVINLFTVFLFSFAFVFLVTTQNLKP